MRKALADLKVFNLDPAVIQKLKSVLTHEMNQIVSGQFFEANGFENANGTSGEDLAIKRVIILEIGWILTNAAFLDSASLNILLQSDNGMEGDDGDSGSILALVKAILGKNKNDLQIIDQYVFFLSNLGFENRQIRKAVKAEIDPFELVDYLMNSPRTSPLLGSSTALPDFKSIPLAFKH